MTQTLTQERPVKHFYCEQRDTHLADGNGANPDGTVGFDCRDHEVGDLVEVRMTRSDTSPGLYRITEIYWGYGCHGVPGMMGCRPMVAAPVDRAGE